MFIELIGLLSKICSALLQVSFKITQRGESKAGLTLAMASGDRLGEEQKLQGKMRDRVTLREFQRKTTNTATQETSL